MSGCNQIVRHFAVDTLVMAGGLLFAYGFAFGWLGLGLVEAGAFFAQFLGADQLTSVLAGVTLRWFGVTASVLFVVMWCARILWR